MVKHWWSFNVLWLGLANEYIRDLNHGSTMVEGQLFQGQHSLDDEKNGSWRMGFHQKSPRWGGEKTSHLSVSSWWDHQPSHTWPTNLHQMVGPWSEVLNLWICIPRLILISPNEAWAVWNGSTSWLSIGSIIRRGSLKELAGVFYHHWPAQSDWFCAFMDSITAACNVVARALI